MFPSPVLRAKCFDRLAPEERAEALKKWRGTAKINQVASPYARQSAAGSGGPMTGPSAALAMKSTTACAVEQENLPTCETVLDLGCSELGATKMPEPSTC